jgi:MoaA/NifB/PqqE/SkfB family radical SAM enzyme
LRHNITSEEDIFANSQKDILSYVKKELSEIQSMCQDYDIHFTHSLNSFFNRTEVETQDKNCKPFLPKCKAPWRKLTIEDSGGIRIDCKCPQTVGNIMESSIERIWNSYMMRKYRSSIISGQVRNICSEICLNNAVENNFFEGI